jgi:two-component system nitrogen regulation sensor histidine kinase GlnL
VLNVAHNAARSVIVPLVTHKSSSRRGRPARTFGKQRYRLATELHVIDNGPGVPTHQGPNFYPLVSGRGRRIGLGLTLAQTFVQQHHGDRVRKQSGTHHFKLLTAALIRWNQRGVTE